MNVFVEGSRFEDGPYVRLRLIELGVFWPADAQCSRGQELLASSTLFVFLSVSNL